VDDLINFLSSFSKITYALLIIYIVGLNFIAKYARKKLDQQKNRLAELRSRLSIIADKCDECEIDEPSKCEHLKEIESTETDLHQTELKFASFERYFLKPVEYIFNPGSFLYKKRGDK
jgi:hypothetical protein